MHPAKQQFWSELGSLLRPVQYVFDVMGQALAAYVPVVLVATLGLVVLAVVGLVLLGRPAHQTDLRTGWAAPNTGSDIERAAA